MFWSAVACHRPSRRSTRTTRPRVAVLLQIPRPQSGMFRYSRQHSRSDLDAVVECPNVVATFGVRQKDVGAFLGFDRISDSQKCTKYLGRFGARPLAHCQAASIETVTVSVGSFCCSMRSARTRRASACADALASFSVAPYAITPGTSAISAIQRPSASRSVSIR